MLEGASGQYADRGGWERGLGGGREEVGGTYGWGKGKAYHDPISSCCKLKSHLLQQNSSHQVTLEPTDNNSSHQWCP